MKTVHILNRVAYAALGFAIAFSLFAFGVL